MGLTNGTTEEKAAMFSPDDIFIALMGITGAGKSTFISRCCQGVDTGIGHNLSSMTQKVSWYTFFHNRQKVHLIDTPGFDDSDRSDSDVLRELAYWLAKSYGDGFRLTGIVYLHPITATRMTGSAFKNLRTFQKLCGKQSMSSVVLVTTMWASVTNAEGDNRETDLKTTAQWWGDMIREGSKTFRHTDDHHSAMNIISYLIDRKTTTVLDLQSEMVDQHLSLDNTEAGREVDGELNKQRERFQREMEDYKKEMNEAIAANDQKHQAEILKEQAEVQKKIDDIQKGRDELKINMEKLMQEQEEEHKRNIAELNQRFEQQKAEHEERIKEFREREELARQQEETDKRKKAALEAEVDAFKANAERDYAEKLVLIEASLIAIQQEQEKAEQEKQKAIQEKEAEMAKSEEKRRQYEKQQAQIAFAQKEMQRQQALYAQQVWQEQQAMQMHWQQQQQAAQAAQTQQYQQYQSSTSQALGAGMGGAAALAFATMSGCSLM